MLSMSTFGAVGLNHSIRNNAQVIRETLNKTSEEIN